MPYIIEGQAVYYQDEKIKELVGSFNKTETNRIDANTVEDVTYAFDIGIGDYVENTSIPRITRTEPIPPTPKTELELLREENDSLKLRASQTSTDFQAFMDYFFVKFPE